MSGAEARRPPQSWATLSQAERDAAYNNNLAVANSADLVAARNAASEAYRAAHAGHLNVPYGVGERQKFDLYPAKDPSAPCLVFIHGGYWQRNSREAFARYAAGAAALGWSVAMPSHTLAPDATLAGIVAEIGLALDWLAAHGGDHGIDGPIILSGWSAGAHLTAMQLAHPAVIGGLAMSGVYELGPIRDTYLNAAMHLTETEVETLSPLRLPVVMKPLVITYGADELPALVWDSRDLHSRRAAANAPSALLPVEGADHFTILDQLLDPDSQVFGLVTMMVP
jgi:acetyl esterase/lipase